MLTLIRKNLLARKIRLLITSFAVLLGVAFMAGTLVFTDTIGRTFDGLFADANKGTDGYVRGQLAFDNNMLGEQRSRVDISLIDEITAVDGVRTAEGYSESYAQIVDSDGEAMGNPDMGAPVLGGPWIYDDALNAYDIASGHPPTNDGEVVIDVSSFEKGGFALGDTTTVLTRAGPQDVDIVGSVSFAGADSPGGASVTLFTPDAAQRFLTGEGKVDGIRIAADDGVSQDELTARVADVLPGGLEVLTGDALTALQQDEIAEDMQFLSVFLLVFAVIALFVGSFIIYNSFSILVAQRRKELALLRAIGGGRRQVLGSVLAEAVTVGLLASVAGLVAGIGVAAGLKSMLSAMGIDLPAGGIVVSPKTIVLSVVTGLLVSIASAIIPARRAGTVPPVAALRDVAFDRSGTSGRRAVIGTAVTALGVAAMAAALFFGAGMVILALGTVVVFLGVTTLGPILARPISRVLGAPLAKWRGVPGTLARENAMRNPKRTSTTAAALMIGVALVGFITILASSTRSSVESSVDKTFTGDLIVSAGNSVDGGLSPQLATDVNDLPEIEDATGLRMTAVQIDGSDQVLHAVDASEAQRVLDLGVTRGTLADLESDTIAVQEEIATDHGWRLGDEIPVTFAETGTHELRLAAIYSEDLIVGDYLVDMDAYEVNVADQFDTLVAMTVADGADVGDARSAVDELAAAYPQAEVQDRAEYADASMANVEKLLNLIYALLALAVFIALLGIANTLALSIHERTRELGLLRAVGMSRSQLRASVRWEATIIALLGTTLGLAIGTGFGWAVVEALQGEGLTTFSIPVDQLAAITLIAACAGVAAAILPARRAARLDILRAITAE